MPKQLIYHICGENHILIEYFINTKEGANNFRNLCLKYNCILQSIITKGNIFKKYGIAYILVPESNLKQFNKEMFNK